MEARGELVFVLFSRYAYVCFGVNERLRRVIYYAGTRNRPFNYGRICGEEKNEKKCLLFFFETETLKETLNHRARLTWSNFKTNMCIPCVLIKGRPSGCTY